MSNPNPFRLIVVSQPQHQPAEPQAVQALFEAGLQTFHLRKPAFAESEMQQWIRQISPQFRQRIVLHSHYQLIEKENLKGIHFTQKTKHLWGAQKNSGSQSVSCHSLAEIPAFAEKADYLFLSPVFESVSKKGYKSGFTLQELRLFLKNSPFRPKIIALGGITRQTLPAARQAGFGGAAVLGALWNNLPAQSTLSTLVERFEKLKKLCL